MDHSSKHSQQIALLHVWHLILGHPPNLITLAAQNLQNFRFYRLAIFSEIPRHSPGCAERWHFQQCGLSQIWHVEAIGSRYPGQSAVWHLKVGPICQTCDFRWKAFHSILALVENLANIESQSVLSVAEQQLRGHFGTFPIYRLLIRCDSAHLRQMTSCQHLANLPPTFSLMQMVQRSLHLGRTKGFPDQGADLKTFILSSFLEEDLGLITESCVWLSQSLEEGVSLLILWNYIFIQDSLASKNYADVAGQLEAYGRKKYIREIDPSYPRVENENELLISSISLLLISFDIYSRSIELFFIIALLADPYDKYYLAIMGAGQSLNERAMHYGVQELNEQSWQRADTILKRTSSTAKLHMVAEECKPVATYFSSKHAFRIDEYLLDSSEIGNLDEYLGEIQWRNQCQYLVNVKYIKGFTRSFICQAGTPKNHIFIEHIPLRLSQITDIPFPENLYLLKACLKGFYYIFLHIHVLEIKEDHICLTEEGRVKVWMNSNLAKHAPSLTNIFKTGKKSELMMVRQIINIVDENTDHQFQPKNFREFLRENKLENLSFSQAILAVEQFASALRIAIPSNLQSVHDLFDPLYVSNKTNNSVHDISPIYNSYEMGRGAETNETRMLQSIPIHDLHERSTFMDGLNRSPQLIKQMESYDCHAHTPTGPSLPFQSIQYPQRVNFVIRNTENKIERVADSAQYVKESHSNQAPQARSGPVSQEEWRYYDVNGWLDIDPEILKDLKHIQSIS